MAQNTTIDVPGGAWKELTDANVTTITFQNQGEYFLYVQGTTGAQPSAIAGSIRYTPGFGGEDASLETLFPGVSGVVRLWAFAYENVRVMVSHA